MLAETKKTTALYFLIAYDQSLKASVTMRYMLANHLRLTMPLSSSMDPVECILR